MTTSFPGRPEPWKCKFEFLIQVFLYLPFITACRRKIYYTIQLLKPLWKWSNKHVILHQKGQSLNFDFFVVLIFLWWSKYKILLKWCPMYIAVVEICSWMLDEQQMAELCQYFKSDCCRWESGCLSINCEAILSTKPWRAQNDTINQNVW